MTDRSDPGLPRPATILGVDMVGYSQRGMNPQSVALQRLRDIIGRVVWQTHIEVDDIDVQDRGDGLLAIIDPSIPKATIVSDLVRELFIELEDRNLTQNDDGRIRLRLSLHYGDVLIRGKKWAGDAVVACVRLLDARQLRDVLGGNPTANIAVIMSDEMFRDTARERLRGLNPESFRSVHVEVLEKNYTSKAWVALPGNGWVEPEKSSGGLESKISHRDSLSADYVSSEGGPPQIRAVQADSMSADEVALLAKKYPTLPDCKRILARAGLRNEDLPSARGPLEFWQKLNQLLEEGTSLLGLPEIVEELIKEAPYDSTLVRMRAKYQNSRRVGDGPSHTGQQSDPKYGLRDARHAIDSTRYDFFVSAAREDEDWGGWITHILEDAGRRVNFGLWDDLSGHSDGGILPVGGQASSRTIVVLSPAYLNSAEIDSYWNGEWDRRGDEIGRFLVPVRIQTCRATGVLRRFSSVDLIGLDEERAKSELINRVDGTFLDGFRPRKRTPYPRRVQ